MKRGAWGLHSMCPLVCAVSQINNESSDHNRTDWGSTQRVPHREFHHVGSLTQNLPDLPLFDNWARENPQGSRGPEEFTQGQSLRRNLLGLKKLCPGKQT